MLNVFATNCVVPENSSPIQYLSPGLLAKGSAISGTLQDACYVVETVHLLQANDVLSRQIVLGLANNAIQMPGQRAYQAE